MCTKMPGNRKSIVRGPFFCSTSEKWRCLAATAEPLSHRQIKSDDRPPFQPSPPLPTSNQQQTSVFHLLIPFLFSPINLFTLDQVPPLFPLNRGSERHSGTIITHPTKNTKSLPPGAVQPRETSPPADGTVAISFSLPCK